MTSVLTTNRLQIGISPCPCINRPPRLIMTMINPDDFAFWLRLGKDIGFLFWWDKTGRGLDN